MSESLLITKAEVRKNKQLKSIQKESKKYYRHKKAHYPRAKLSKLVRLSDANSFCDFTEGKDNSTPPRDMNRDTIREELLSSNLLGLSGSGFPFAKKLQTLLESKAGEKYLIINGVECDPGLLHDKWLLENRLPEIEKGIDLLSKCERFQKIILATKENLICHNSCYELRTVANRYPMGEEKILIKEVLGKTLSGKELPASKGILVLNVQTVYALYEAIYKKQPFDSRFITIANLTTGETTVARVPFGSNIMKLTAKIGNLKDNTPVYHGGGIFFGKKTMKEDTVTATTNFIGYGKEAVTFADSKCRKCGVCTRKCPMDIKVNKIILYLENKNLSAINKQETKRCIQCGTCTYYCPAGKNTMELISSCNA